MQVFDQSALSDFSSETRRNFLNKISGIRTAHLIGSANSRGDLNLALFNSIIHIGAKPPLLGFILRPTTVRRDTYENILETGYYSINALSTSMLKQAHQTSAKYEESVSEFETTALEPEFSDTCEAPMVKGSPIQLLLKFEEEHFVKANETRLMVGRIIEARIKENSLTEDDHLKVEDLDLLTVSGLDTYFKVSALGRESYARP